MPSLPLKHLRALLPDEFEDAMSLKIGYASRDITPEPGITMSGFAARCNRPCEGVDDLLTVHALYLEQGGEQMLLLVFDLLALGPEILEEIHCTLDRCPGLDIPRHRRLFCCTHTHSAPSVITLLGCGIPEQEYWQQVCREAANAAVEACRNSRQAVLRMTAVPLSGASYYRRQVLADGRVVMAHSPDVPVVKSGAVWESMLLLRFEDMYGMPIAGVAHWAAHPATVCGINISADYPGELCRRLSAQCDMPFLFLQGACGNINAPHTQADREDLLRDMEGLMAQLEGIAWPAETTPVTPCSFTTEMIRLPYAPVPEKAVLQQFHRGMAEIAATGDGPAETLAALSNILNVGPGEQVDPVMLRYIADNMREWSERVLATSQQPDSCEIALAMLRLGPLACCFIAAEVFVETAVALQSAFPALTVATVGYAGPLVGYLPTDEAMGEGGYEVESAYRFFAHPAPFAPGAEPRVREALAGMIGRAES